jgi:Undecaprenyl-phosphate galactose phosphotransferase WbaP
VLLATLMFAFVLPPMAVSVLRTALVRRGCWGEPVALLGSANAAAGIVRILREHPDLGLVPAGIFDDDPDKWHTTIEGIPVLGPLTNGELARTKARTGILVDPVADPDRLADLIARLPFEKVLILPDLLGVQSLWVTTRDLGGLLALEVKNNLRCRQNRILKMAFDYTLGVILLIVCLPVIGIFAVSIKWVSPGPFLYSQVREGLNGRKFRMWKLRSMHPDADRRLEEHLEQSADSRAEWQRFMKLKNDPRILPVVGNFLRRWSLDELPQLWNVVRGEMSLIGPRPFPEYHLGQFNPDFRRLRRQVRPGVTGLWQVLVRSQGDLDIQQSLDTYYIRYWSLWQDLFILCRTPGVVLSRRGAA